MVIGDDGDDDVLLWRLREPGKDSRPRKIWKEIVDKDMNDLHLKPSDAEDRSKWREMNRQGLQWQQ